MAPAPPSTDADPAVGVTDGNASRAAKRRRRAMPPPTAEWLAAGELDAYNDYDCLSHIVRRERAAAGDRITTDKYTGGVHGCIRRRCRYRRQCIRKYTQLYTF